MTTRIVSSPETLPRIPSSSAASSAAATPGAVPDCALTSTRLPDRPTPLTRSLDHPLKVQVLGEHVDAFGQLAQSHLGDVARDRRLGTVEPLLLETFDECTLGAHPLAPDYAPNRLLALASLPHRSDSCLSKMSVSRARARARPSVRAAGSRPRRTRPSSRGRSRRR